MPTIIVLNVLRLRV